MNVDEAKELLLRRIDGGGAELGEMAHAAIVLDDDVGRLRRELDSTHLSLAWQESISAGRGEENERLRQDVRDLRDQYHAQLEAVHDLTETLAEERVQHAAQMERVRSELAATVARIAAWDDALGAVVPELEREMAPERPRLVGP